MSQTEKITINKQTKRAPFIGALFYINNSVINTIKQLAAAVMNKLLFFQATMIAVISASVPEIQDCVAVIMAGNVITESVTYGT